MSLALTYIQFKLFQINIHTSTPLIIFNCSKSHDLAFVCWLLGYFIFLHCNFPFLFAKFYTFNLHIYAIRQKKNKNIVLFINKKPKKPQTWQITRILYRHTKHTTYKQRLELKTKFQVKKKLQRRKNVHFNIPFAPIKIISRTFNITQIKQETYTLHIIYYSATHTRYMQACRKRWKQNIVE